MEESLVKPILMRARRQLGFRDDDMSDGPDRHILELIRQGYRDADVIASIVRQALDLGWVKT